MNTLKISTDPNDIYYKDRVLTAEKFDKVEFAKHFEHRRTKVDNVDFHYVIGGTGPIILFGHGWPASWFEWRKVLPLLKEEFTCIAFDMPGLGDSSPPPAFDNKTIADLIKKLVTKNLGLKEIFVVGHDVSGPGLITMAAYYPDLVKKMFLTETSIFGPEMGQVLAENINDIWHFPVNASRLAATLAIGKEENFIEQFFSKWVYNVGAIHKEDLEEYVRTARIPGVIECGASYYHKQQHHAEGGGILPKKSLTMPIHFLGAELGFGGELGGENKAAFKTIDRYATNTSYEVVEKCSHWVSEDRPVFLAKKISGFFKN
ncbi:alpha/beta hydrolase [Aquimarina gracilis]|uniref:Alpha/beta hydrolase n=1 Tax=Aquimarina gracilis TaxID=874422 RepID=A0ABU5ZVT8_9FLAO|nr:alpha/beta hydrolase [Aquimarina gracilis]MEB3345960.1 alpha/beta hydrolase [Aquimarina gracilis]